MICQNCHATVDNDLVFCTECGARLHETLSQTPTALINDSVVTKISAAQPPKPKSNLKWMALLAVIIALPASLFFAYYLYTNSKNTPTAANTKPANKNSAPAINNKQNINSGAGNNSVNSNNLPEANSKVANLNANLTNQTTDENVSAVKGTEIWNDRIEIAPGTHLAVPFKIESDSRITGNIQLLQGESIEGYVYLQKEYDEHFPDTIYKVFSFGDGKEAKIEQTLVKENYVLVFVNNSKSATVIQGKVLTTNQ